MNTSEPLRIGIDIGRVLLGPTAPDGGADSSFLSGTTEQALAVAPTAGAFEALAGLVRRTGGNTWLVSKCGPRIEALTRLWLDHHRVFDRTGLPPGHVRFCLRRPDKRVHAEELRLTRFVDDRVDQGNRAEPGPGTIFARCAGGGKAGFRVSALSDPLRASGDEAS